MALTNVRIHSTPGGCKIELDGADVSNKVRSAALALPTPHNGNLPILHLEVPAAHLEFFGEAVVRVPVDDFDPAQAILQFLEAFDSGVLDRLMQEELDIAGGTMGAVALAALRRAVRP